MFYVGQKETGVGRWRAPGPALAGCLWWLTGTTPTTARSSAGVRVDVGWGHPATPPADAVEAVAAAKAWRDAERCVPGCCVLTLGEAPPRHALAVQDRPAALPRAVALHLDVCVQRGRISFQPAMKGVSAMCKVGRYVFLNGPLGDTPLRRAYARLRAPRSARSRTSV